VGINSSAASGKSRFNGGLLETVLLPPCADLFLLRSQGPNNGADGSSTSYPFRSKAPSTAVSFGTVAIPHMHRSVYVVPFHTDILDLRLLMSLCCTCFTCAYTCVYIIGYRLRLDWEAKDERPPPLDGLSARLLSNLVPSLTKLDEVLSLCLFTPGNLHVHPIMSDNPHHT